jgi:hypothetical protein
VRYLSYIRRSPQSYFFLFVLLQTRIYNYKISNVAHTVRNLLKVTNCFHQSATYVQWGTAVGRSRVLWTRREFGIRILNGLIVLMLEVITNLVMCSGRNFNV